MGMGEDFWGGDLDNLLRAQLEPTGISLEELREKGYVFVERTDGAQPTEPEYRNYAKLFEKLPNGKVQCYNEIIGGMPNNRDDGTLEFMPIGDAGRPRASPRRPNWPRSTRWSTSLTSMPTA